MNVLIAVPWDQRGGGVATVVGNLGKYLEGRGHNVYFFHPHGSAVFLRRAITRWGFQGFRHRLSLPFSRHRPVLSALAFPVLFPVSLIQLTRMILRNRIDVVNVHYPTGLFFFFALCRKFLPMKLVISIHGADIFPKGHRRERYDASLKFLLNSSDLIVANSQAYRRDFLSLFPALEKRTIAIHNGVDLDKLSEPLGQGDHKNGRRYLLSVANHNEKKGVDVLIRAFSVIAKGDSELDLMLVGDGPLRSKLEELARSLALQQRVIFLGRKDHAEVARLMHGCELFVHPAVSEPFGLVVAEALACKKPVVASNTGGIPEIIEDGTSGILVEPGRPQELARAISSVLGDPNLMNTLSANGYAVAEKYFSHANTGRNYEKTFCELVAPAS
jgi:glycosyltransferase involved in cell wall biosynthesis